MFLFQKLYPSPIYDLFCELRQLCRSGTMFYDTVEFWKPYEIHRNVFDNEIRNRIVYCRRSILARGITSAWIDILKIFKKHFFLFKNNKEKSKTFQNIPKTRNVISKKIHGGSLQIFVSIWCFYTYTFLHIHLYIYIFTHIGVLLNTFYIFW